MPGTRTLLVIGIHREELAFGRDVVQGLEVEDLDVLEIPEGLSGRRPCLMRPSATARCTGRSTCSCCPMSEGRTAC